MGRMKLYFFDVRSLTMDCINIDEVLEENVKNELRHFESQFGIKIRIEGIKNAEEFIRNYYENKGYKVMKNTPRERNNIFPHWYEIKEILEVEKEEFEKDVHETGVPDFFVWNKKEAFFVEAKSWGDSLNSNQLIWMFSHNKFYPIKIFVQREDDENRFRPSIAWNNHSNDDEEENLRID